MKKNAKIVGRNSDSMIEVTIRFKTKGYGLTSGEVKRVVTEAANQTADAIRKLPYTSFGPHNTQVTV